MIMNAVSRFLGRWHRPLAWLAVLPVLLWAVSGLLHPVMTRLGPELHSQQAPAAWFQAPDDGSWSAQGGPADVLPPDLMLRSVRPVTWSGQGWWLAEYPDGQLRFLATRDGRPDASALPHWLETLARDAAGDQEADVVLSRVTAFSDAYPSVNRYLPVWSVRFEREDGLTVFIEPRLDKVITATTSWKTRWSRFFRVLHTGEWWPHAGSRTAVLSVLLVVLLMVTTTGVGRAWRQARVSGRGLRVHGWLGVFAALAILGWTCSGLAHLWLAGATAERLLAGDQPLAASVFRAGDLRQPVPDAGWPVETRWQVVATSAGPLWRAQHVMSPPSPHAAGHAHSSAHASHASGDDTPVLHEGWWRADSGEPVPSEAWLRQLAARVTGEGRRPVAIEAVTHFTPEYGFINKRLPVWRLDYEGAKPLTVYIDPADSLIASVVTTSDRLEGMAFAYLHKGHLFELLGNAGRDLLLAIFAALVLALAGLGIRQYRR